jgi:hypothetical protein
MALTPGVFQRSRAESLPKYLQDQSEGQAQKQTRGQGKVEAKTLPFDVYVARQTPQKRNVVHDGQKESDHGDQHAQ